MVLKNGASLKARAVMLATGARWRNLGVPGEFEYRNRGVAYCPHCDGPLFKGKRVAVIGGGNSGVEAAIDLANIVGHVTLIEFDRASARRPRCCRTSCAACRTWTSISHAQTTEMHRRRRAGERAGLTGPRELRGRSARSSWKACSSRSGWCPTPGMAEGLGACELSRFGEIQIDDPLL